MAGLKQRIAKVVSNFWYKWYPIFFFINRVGKIKDFGLKWDRVLGIEVGRSSHLISPRMLYLFSRYVYMDPHDFPSLIKRKDTPQFELLFRIVLYHSTSPSGHRYLLQNIESTETVKACRERKRVGHSNSAQLQTPTWNLYLLNKYLLQQVWIVLSHVLDIIGFPSYVVLT